jgi:hypothetical protein
MLIFLMVVFIIVFIFYIGKVMDCENEFNNEHEKKENNDKES